MAAKNFIRNINLTLGAALVCALIFPSLAGAFSSHYFDDGDVTPKDEVDVVAGKGRYTVDANVNLYVYFDSPEGKITFNNFDFCRSTSNKYSDQYDTSYKVTHASGTQPVTQYTIEGGTVDTFTGNNGAMSEGVCGRGDITRDVSGLPYNESVRKYYAKVTATAANPDNVWIHGSLNFFSVDAKNTNGSTTGVIIAHAGGDTGREVTVEQRSGHSLSEERDEDFLDYRIKFGSDCTITANTEKAITVYDLDNLGDTGETTTNTQMFRHVKVSLYRSNGSLVHIWGRNGDDNYFDGTSFTPKNGGNKTIKINFMAEPNTSYYLEMVDVFSNNTIQYGTPFDGIYHDIQCPTVDLFPKIEIPTDVILPGTEIGTITHDVINNNDADATRDSPYAVYEYVIKRGKTKQSSDDIERVFSNVKNVRGTSVRYAEATISTTACDWLMIQGGGFNNIDPACKYITGGNGTFNEAHNILTGLDPIVADNYQLGDLICRILSVGHYDYISSGMQRRISEPVCVILAKAPSVQVWGHDVRVGDSIYAIGKTNGPNDGASVHTRFIATADAKYGSWAEYGIFAPSTGVIRSVSGGAIASAPAKPLSFANTTAPDAGQWSPARVTPTILDKLPTLPEGQVTSGTINLQQELNNHLDNGEWYRVRNNSDSVTIKNGNHEGYHASRGTVVIDMTGGAGNKTVTIADNIILNRPGGVAYTKLGNATQIIIVVKGNIIINSNVSQIDAWLVALPSSDNSPDGIISTCNEITTPYYKGLTVSHECNNNKLTINGAVMAKQIQLRRTNGAEKPDYGAPAEVINLRADAYMWGPNSTSNEDGVGYPIRTIMTKELPPRF